MEGGPEERILMVLFMSSAVGRGRAIKIEDLAKKLGFEPSALDRFLNELSSLGYLTYTGGLVYLTEKGVLRVLSKFS